MSILLYGDIDRLSLKILEGEAKLVRSVVLFFGEFEIGEHSLKLMENIVIYLFTRSFGEALWLSVVCHQNERSKRLSHEELLKHRNHVTNTSQISNACIA